MMGLSSQITWVWEAVCRLVQPLSDGGQMMVAGFCTGGDDCLASVQLPQARFSPADIAGWRSLRNQSPGVLDTTTACA